ncbi:hypothetical protein L208DRAFT_1407100 [Tricholoma matsutake]|nr:hypothetical protein L208DRAFT_1407100 [Tricholoma matsutake 945]
MFFQTCSRDPPRCMFQVRLDQRVKQHPRTLDIPDLGVAFQNNAVERGKIPFGVDGRRCVACGP